MRWIEQPAELPWQPLSVLGARVAGVDDGTVTDAGLLVIVPHGVRAAVLQHLQESADEQGGLLLGEVFTDDAQAGASASRAVVLRQAVPALDFASSGISLRMESGVWERARHALGRCELIVGWYHSHPGLGAFFSATDRRTQAAFFAHPYSVGWVIDPLHDEEAFFVGRDCAAPGAVRPRASDALPAAAESPL